MDLSINFTKNENVVNKTFVPYVYDTKEAKRYDVIVSFAKQ